MTTVIIDRDDFNGHKDSEGNEYFDGILSQLGIPSKDWYKIQTIELNVTSAALVCEILGALKESSHV